MWLLSSLLFGLLISGPIASSIPHGSLNRLGLLMGVLHGERDY